MTTSTSRSPFKLTLLSGFWIAGIALGLLLPFPLSAVPAVALSLGTFLALGFRRKALLVSFSFLLMLAGVLRAQGAVPSPELHPLALISNLSVLDIRGVVTSYPEVLDKTTRFQMAHLEVRSNDGWRPIPGALQVLARESRQLVESRDAPYFRYGDSLQLTGKAEPPPKLESFDYRDYLARQGVFAIMAYPQVKLLDEGQGNRALQVLYRLRMSLARGLATSLPEPHAALAQGILLGIRTSIPKELNEALARTNTTHLIAISGLNVGIIMGMLMGLFQALLGRRWRFYLLLPLATIWLYALLTGFAPPVVRGTMMGSLFLFSHWIGREESAPTGLMASAAVMLGFSPGLLYDLSFQLSFLAMAGLIFISPGLARGLQKTFKIADDLTGTRGFRSGVIFSVAALLGAVFATAPLLAFTFGRVSLLGLPATLLAAAAMPGIMLLSFATAVATPLLPWLGSIVGWADWLWTSYMLLVVRLFNAVPLAAIEVGKLSPALVGGYYLALGSLLWLLAHRGLPQPQAAGRAVRSGLARLLLETGPPPVLKAARRLLSRGAMRLLLLPLGTFSLLLWLAVLTPERGDLKVFFLDVGQGDAILVQTPRGQHILIDGGPSPRAVSLALGHYLPFWDRTIDLVVLTHSGEDHLAGLLEVAERYRVQAVLHNGLTSNSVTYLRWQKLLLAHDTPAGTALAGQTIDLGEGATLAILNPPPKPRVAADENDNNNSVVLRLEYGQVSFLLTGDIQEQAEQALIASGVSLSSTVLKVAHHGSRSSTSEAMLATVHPRVAVISAGKDNPFGHPHPETLERLRRWLPEDQVYLTPRDGTIELTTDGVQLWATTRQGP